MKGVIPSTRPVPGFAVTTSFLGLVCFPAYKWAAKLFQSIRFYKHSVPNGAVKTGYLRARRTMVYIRYKRKERLSRLGAVKDLVVRPNTTRRTFV